MFFHLYYYCSFFFIIWDCLTGLEDVNTGCNLASLFALFFSGQNAVIKVFFLLLLPFGELLSAVGFKNKLHSVLVYVGSVVVTGFCSPGRQNPVTVQESIEQPLSLLCKYI